MECYCSYCQVDVEPIGADECPTCGAILFPDDDEDDEED